MTSPSPNARTSMSGFSIYEMVVGVFLVFALVLGILTLVTMEGTGTEEDYGVSPYRAMYATYIYGRLQEWSSVFHSFSERFGALPGDSPRPPFTDGQGRNIVGNGDSRVERERGENLKFSHDLYAAGMANQPAVLVRGRAMDFYWREGNANGTRSKAGNYMKLPNINRDEALALDHKYDDGSRDSGNVFYFDNPDGSVDLFVLNNAY